MNVRVFDNKILLNLPSTENKILINNSNINTTTIITTFFNWISFLSLIVFLIFTLLASFNWSLIFSGLNHSLDKYHIGQFYNFTNFITIFIIMPVLVSPMIVDVLYLILSFGTDILIIDILFYMLFPSILTLNFNILYTIFVYIMFFRIIDKNYITISIHSFWKTSKHVIVRKEDIILNNSIKVYFFE